MMPHANRRCLAAAAVLFVLAACSHDAATAPTAGGASAPAPVVVYAAASLAGAFQEIGAAFAQQEPQFAPQFVFEGSPSLVLKLQQGSAADVLATADQPNMDKVVAAGLTAAAPTAFAQNRLAIVVGKGNPQRIAGLADLARSELKVALCGPTVPAGRYAREALGKAGVALASRSDEASVTALCGKVKLGELDAGIAYVTDARTQGVEAIAIPAEHNVVANYPIAALTSGRARAGGERFVACVRSATGRRILADHGFALP